MYNWVVFLHGSVIFVFIIQHAAEIFVTFKLRELQEPDGVDATYPFMLNNNSRNLCIIYSLIILTGATARVRFNGRAEFHRKGIMQSRRGQVH